MEALRRTISLSEDSEYYRISPSRVDLPAQLIGRYFNELFRQFATCAHRKQVRKYTNEPYINHCLEVAGLVCDLGGTHSPDMVKAAWLHDTIEDTDVTADEIYEVFGRNVWRLVLGLTDSAPLSLGNRAKRKAYERDRLAAESSDVQTIKCCDLISNTRSIVQYDPEFAKVYLVEKRNLLEVMTRASGAARSHAFDVLKQAEEALKIGGR